MNTYGFLFTNDTATIMGGGRTVAVKRSSVEFDEVASALKLASSASEAGNSRLAERYFQEAFNAFDKAEAIRSQSKGAFLVTGGVVTRNGVPIHNVVTSRVMEFAACKLPFEPLVAFLEKIDLNPSPRSKEELYKFLENQNLPVALDGDFFAYKSVQSDWFSKTSGSEEVEVSTDGGKTFKVFVGKIPNKVGSIIRMKRSLVDDNANRTCSRGLHVGALAYAGPQGWFNNKSDDRCVLVKVNPKNCVSVPTDHSAQKLRVSEYEVVSEFGGALSQPLVTEKAVPVNTKQTVTYRCRDCRGRKKASTFVVDRKTPHGRRRCPRCNGRNVSKL